MIKISEAVDKTFTYSWSDMKREKGLYRCIGCTEPYRFWSNGNGEIYQFNGFANMIHNRNIGTPDEPFASDPKYLFHRCSQKETVIISNE
jgi:uncharacterized heparinase superfamily protein